MSLAGVFAGIFLLAALYCGLDPLHHSALHGFPDFEAVKVDLPPWSEVPSDRDALNLLQRSAWPAEQLRTLLVLPFMVVHKISM
ncbi:hypothetical protein CRG98_006281 [Punica granatum]|uniref:Uncharacterized protein n=1 Tax=Punica granatum TaxID=22663 RepID=A0A2I0KYB6_PUNGR|nr:hypothetical protein CRG98_006281 [Punica granatum]